jgi:hypothetical protein
VSGDTVTWDSTWTDDQGREYCAEGHRAVIADGTFVTWTFGPGPDGPEAINRRCP